MPTYGWILESAVDHLADWANTSRSLPLAVPQALTTAWSCHLPWCGLEFTSEEGLQEHLFTAHRQIDLSVRVGRRVYTDTPIIVDEPGAVRVVTTGLDELKVHFEVPPHWREVPLTVHAAGQRRTVDLPGHVLTSAPGRVRLVARWGNGSRTFDLYCGAPVELDDSQARTVERPTALLQDDLLQGRPDWTGAQRDMDRQPTLERRYGQGLREYLFAHSLDVGADWNQTKDAYRHFERAYWLLSPFSRPLARVAIHLIALRLGWYPVLANTTVRRLAGAAGFFHVPPQPPRLSRKRPEQASSGLVLDEFHHKLLDAIDRYWADDHSGAATILVGLGSPNSVYGDRIRAMKLHLAWARVARASGDSARARASYQELLDSPDFKREAESFL